MCKSNGYRSYEPDPYALKLMITELKERIESLEKQVANLTTQHTIYGGRI